MGGRSERDLGDSLLKTNAPRCQFINMGRRDTLRVIAGDVICPQRIQGDQEDIGFSRLGRLHPYCVGAVRTA